MKIGIVFGAWDLLHAGHVHLLKECKRYCNYLVLGLHVDPSVERPSKNSPVESLLERQMRLRGCSYVDNIIVYETEDELSMILKYLKPDIRFVGSEYLDKDRHITDEGAVPIKYIDSLPIHTSSLRERIKKAK